MSAEETVLSLFDSYWFEYGVFTAKPPLSTVKISPVVQEEDQEPAAGKGPTLNRITTLMRKSYSDQCLSSKDSSGSSDSLSPKSVLGPQLQTILSGKEVESFQDFSSPKEGEISIDIVNTDNSRVYPSHTVQGAFCTEPDRNRQTGPSIYDMRRKRRKSRSRSMSELEFEELKGFMDLGFVFSDEDMDSRLVSIIPGLQKLGKNVEESDKGFGGEPSVSRPYLSEAWDSLEDLKRVKNPLMDWRIPAFGNEMELKDHLRFWAHTVASTVR
ncbi:hypothetical protein Pfo_013780 [Paulownia fortunei]|nr:hypothetical protein Pfo_013780 [Paulownia fortunei]